MNVVPTCGNVRFTSDVHGDDADDVDQISEMERKLRTFCWYLTSCTSGDANRLVRNSGDSQGLEAWRRLHNEYDPTSSMGRVTILGTCRMQTRSTELKILDFILRIGWQRNVSQYEQLANRDGTLLSGVR